MRKKQMKNYLYILPAFVFLVLFTIYPILRSAWLSFFDTDAVLSYTDFVGLKNYREMVESPVFREVAANTLIFGILQVVLSTVLGFLAALLASGKKNRMKGIFKVALFYPYILPWTVGAMVWMYILHPTRGIVNMLLHTRIQWLNSYQLTLYVLVLISVWKTVGFNFLFFLSGIQTISEELWEAYSMDSKSVVKWVWHVVIPLISPTAFAVILLTVVGSFQSVDLIYILTQGRPGNSTNTMIYYIYQEGITNWDIGYGSALSTVLFLGLLLFTVVYLFVGERKVNYEQ